MGWSFGFAAGLVDLWLVVLWDIQLVWLQCLVDSWICDMSGGLVRTKSKSFKQ